ncbi:3-oxoacyl-[acyl-carrier protein] reductase [Melghirimyces profundicolus]|uniref:3-oxoacyl-[acyl-carrier protein] reductase n=1 Tax=Melghirimyces profundicolus TaxID=1242148 RepID=A0A2T6BGA2_9BACL|nr:SDR family oxidoreductase [Melghirimyces profundicolus]PTX55095.1 3-oxoacyl-[acyl-carrier protein] reductase [Melghirimyces profundicolus]
MESKQNRDSALVTGAGRLKGIGAAICRALAEGGADIWFTCRPGPEEEEAEKLKRELREKGIRARFSPLDLSDPSAPMKLLDEVESTWHLPRVLVNNAAHSVRDVSFDTLDAEVLDVHYAVNLRAPLLLSAAFVKRCEAGRGGRIISMTSGQSLGPMPGELAYAATKGGMDAFTRTLAAEAAPKGITVNAVNPGPTDTGWMTDEIRKELLPRFPMGRPGEPVDAARLIAFLASREAQWITGQILHSEGGFLR